jgi:uncharacterized protein YecE (DUF72 family)
MASHGCQARPGTWEAISYRKVWWKMANVLRIGTSGWHYAHWRGIVYPEELTTQEWFAYYAERFSTVEINNSFYKLPEVETFRAWREGSPPGFLFAVKASRYITHMKKLKDPEEPIANVMERVDELGDRLGPILFQLPPKWKRNADRLRAFLDKLPAGKRFAFEFRDPSWFDEGVYELLSAHNAAFCIYDLRGELTPKQVTADWVYVRLHGPGEPYQGKYDERTLAGWTEAFASWRRQGRDVYCYFNNDQAGYAVENALALQAMSGGSDGSGHD